MPALQGGSICIRTQQLDRPLYSRRSFRTRIHRSHATFAATRRPPRPAPHLDARLRDGRPGHAGHRFCQRALGRHPHPGGQGHGPRHRDAAPAQPVQLGAQGCRDRPARLPADRGSHLPAALSALGPPHRAAPGRDPGGRRRRPGPAPHRQRHRRNHPAKAGRTARNRRHAQGRRRRRRVGRGAHRCRQGRDGPAARPGRRPVHAATVAGRGSTRNLGLGLGHLHLLLVGRFAVAAGADPGLGRGDHPRIPRQGAPGLGHGRPVGPGHAPARRSPAGRDRQARAGVPGRIPACQRGRRLRGQGRRRPGALWRLRPARRAADAEDRERARTGGTGRQLAQAAAPARRAPPGISRSRRPPGVPIRPNWCWRPPCRTTGCMR